MTKYLIELREASTGDMVLLQLNADSPEQATRIANQSHSDYEVVRVKCTHGGKRSGAGRMGKWGDGVETKAYRLPTTFGENLPEILAELEMINSILEAYEDKVVASKSKTASGQPAERYKYVAQILSDLRQAMQVTGGKLV